MLIGYRTGICNLRNAKSVHMFQNIQTIKFRHWIDYLILGEENHSDIQENYFTTNETTMFKQVRIYKTENCMSAEEVVQNTEQSKKLLIRTTTTTSKIWYVFQ